MDNETFYDTQIAPELARLARLCADQGMSFLAAVEYAPGDIGETRLLVTPSWSLELAALAIMAQGNLDRLVINAARRIAQRSELDAKSSLVLQQFLRL